MYITMRKQASAAARVFTILAAAAVFSGCAMKGDIRDLQMEMRAEMAAMAARQDSIIAQLSSQATSTQDTLRTQADQMFEFRGDINQSIQAMMQSLQRLEAVAGENQRAIASMRDQLANARLSGGAAPTVVTNPSGGDPGGEQLIGGAGSPDAAWDAAMDQLDRGSLRTATEAFNEFLSGYPNDERSVQAQFYLADILAQGDDLEGAIAAFEEIQTLHPESEMVPAALYRIAELQIEMDDEDAARVTLERIVNTYQEHSMAMLARGLLEEIGG